MSEEMNNVTTNDVRFLIINIFLSLIVASVGYAIQFMLFDDWFHQQGPMVANFFRMIRMIIGYVVIPILYLRGTGQSITNFGLSFAISKTKIIASIILGIAVYLVPSYIFAHYEIFTAVWLVRSIKTTIIIFSTIAVMAMITDLWTRGFVLLQVERLYGDTWAILIQNIIWFGIHVYEILILVSYIGWVGAVSLTLFLGIAGDLLTLKTRNISGLLIGHVVLNLAIVLQGKGFLNW